MNTRTNSHVLDTVKREKGIKLVHLNIRSFLANIDEAKVDLLDGLLDIVAFSETWLHSQCSNNLLQVTGYNLFRHDRKTVAQNGKVKRGGGIAVYIRDEFDVRLWPSLNVSNADLELLCISCKLGNNKRINLLVTYRPPTGKLQSAIDMLTGNIAELRSLTSGEVVVIGDFNVDLLSNNVQSRNLATFAVSSGVSQLIECPTRITGTSSTLIDHLYTDIAHVSSKGTLNYNVSDHLPVFLIKKRLVT